MPHFKNKMNSDEKEISQYNFGRVMRQAGSAANLAHATGLTTSYVSTYVHRKYPSPLLALRISQVPSLNCKREQLRPDLNEFDWQRLEDSIDVKDKS